MQRSKQIKTNSPSFNLRLIYPLFIPLCLCSYQNKQIENHPNGILPSPNLWNTRLYIFQKGCSSQRVWNILKRSAKETQTDCGHLDWFLLGSVIFCIFWSCTCCSDMEFVKCLHQWDSRNFQFYLRPIFFEQMPFSKIPSEMEVAPRYNCWHCWHCWHCWYCSTLLTWRIMSSHFIHICLVPIFQ